MSLILIDGFDDLINWSLYQTGVTVVAGGRTGNCLQLSSITAYAGYNIPAAQRSDYITVGYAARYSALTSSPDVIRFFGDAGVTVHSVLRINTDGSLSAVRSSTTLASTAAGLIATNTWYYFEIQLRLHDTLGTYVVRVNGVQVINFGPGDTRNAGTVAVYDRFEFYQGASMTMLVDDVYVMTGAGDAFLGDCAVETLYPNGNGNANAWQGNDGDSTNNYLLVDETGVDITDYVGASTSGQQDLYAMTNPVLRGGAILGVCHNSYLARVDPSITSFKQVSRGATDTKQTQPVADTLAAYNYVLTTNPETGAAWTYAALDALQSGVEVT